MNGSPETVDRHRPGPSVTSGARRRPVVPVFISHLGCPHRCIFCDQRQVNGQWGELPSGDAILNLVAFSRERGGGGAVEVAFFGGTFTSLPEADQEMLLAPLRHLREGGAVAAVRVSTRPDAISAVTPSFLRRHGVTTVELGVQSLDDQVLARAGRGYRAVVLAPAVARLREAGLEVGLQLMPGLPGETSASALATLDAALALRPDFLRIYPALVLAGTELERLHREEGYRPLSLRSTLTLGKKLLHKSLVAGVPVIRFGLHPSSELARPGVVTAGPFHPALRELVEGELWYDLAIRLLARLPGRGEVVLGCPPAKVSLVVGQRRRNLRRLSAHCGGAALRVTAMTGLDPWQLTMARNGEHCGGDLRYDLAYLNSEERGA